jgi:hypothetical protein
MKTPSKMLLLTILLSVRFVNAQDIYTSKDNKVSFYSYTPVENIEAISKNGVSALNAKTGQVYFKIDNTSFEFKAKLMEEHFNENYMESHKYPVSEFKGRVIEPIDIKKLGEYKVTIEGKLTMHGVTKEYKIPATLVIQQGKVAALITFKIKLVDHQIEVPNIVFSKIAEEIEIKVASNFLPTSLISKANE